VDAVCCLLVQVTACVADVLQPVTAVEKTSTSRSWLTSDLNFCHLSACMFCCPLFVTQIGLPFFEHFFLRLENRHHHCAVTCCHVISSSLLIFCCAHCCSCHNVWSHFHFKFLSFISKIFLMRTALHFSFTPSCSPESSSSRSSSPFVISSINLTPRVVVIG
jgi:hypothetical protein